MSELVIRKANLTDMGEIEKLLVAVFAGEQGFPADDVACLDGTNHQWWCAALDGESADGQIVGAVASWETDGETHWGRFAVNPRWRGQHIGTRLAAQSFHDLFSQGVEVIHMTAREQTVKIVCGMGGKVTGAAEPFFKGTVTPVVIEKGEFVWQDGI